MCDGGVYPDRNKPGGYDLYSELLAHFIRDVRKDLAAPEMPFVIGVMGVGGVREEPDYFRQAMAAPAALPEFQGNVAAVQTAPFWDEALVAASAKRGEFNRILDTAYTLNEDGRLDRDCGASSRVGNRSAPRNPKNGPGDMSPLMFNGIPTRWTRRRRSVSVL